MREVREGHQALVGQQQPPRPQEGLQVAGTDAHAPPELVADLRRRRFVGPRRRHEEDLPARVQSHEHRDEEVVHDGGGREPPIAGPVEGVNRTVGSEHRAEVRLQRFDPRLVAPVGAVQVPGRNGRAQIEAADDRARRRVAPQRRDQRAHGVGIEEGVGVGEDHDVTARPFHEVVQDAGLAPPVGKRDEVHHVARARLHDRRREIGGSIGPDHDIEAVARVIERVQILQPIGNDVFFVVGRHDDTDAGPLGRLAGSTRASGDDLAEQPQESGVSHVGVRQQGERAERQHREDHRPAPADTTSSHRAANFRAIDAHANRSSTSRRPAAPSVLRCTGSSSSATTARAKSGGASARR